MIKILKHTKATTYKIISESAHTRVPKPVDSNKPKSFKERVKSFLSKFKGEKKNPEKNKYRDLPKASDEKVKNAKNSVMQTVTDKNKIGAVFSKFGNFLKNNWKGAVGGSVAGALLGPGGYLLGGGLGMLAGAAFEKGVKNPESRGNTITMALASGIIAGVFAAPVSIVTGATTAAATGLYAGGLGGALFGGSGEQDIKKSSKENRNIRRMDAIQEGFEKFGYIKIYIPGQPAPSIIPLQPDEIDKLANFIRLPTISNPDFKEYNEVINEINQNPSLYVEYAPELDSAKNPDKKIFRLKVENYLKLLESKGIKSEFVAPKEEIDDSSNPDQPQNSDSNSAEYEINGEGFTNLAEIDDKKASEFAKEVGNVAKEAYQDIINSPEDQLDEKLKPASANNRIKALMEEMQISATKSQFDEIEQAVKFGVMSCFRKIKEEGTTVQGMPVSLSHEIADSVAAAIVEIRKRKVETQSNVQSDPVVNQANVDNSQGYAEFSKNGGLTISRKLYSGDLGLLNALSSAGTETPTFEFKLATLNNTEVNTVDFYFQVKAKLNMLLSENDPKKIASGLRGVINIINRSNISVTNLLPYLEVFEKMDPEKIDQNLKEQTIEAFQAETKTLVGFDKVETQFNANLSVALVQSDILKADDKGKYSFDSDIMVDVLKSAGVDQYKGDVYDKLNAEALPKINEIIKTEFQRLNSLPEDQQQAEAQKAELEITNTISSQITLVLNSIIKF